MTKTYILAYKKDGHSYFIFFHKEFLLDVVIQFTKWMADEKVNFDYESYWECRRVINEMKDHLC